MTQGWIVNTEGKKDLFVEIHIIHFLHSVKKLKTRKSQIEFRANKVTLADHLHGIWKALICTIYNCEDIRWIIIHFSIYTIKGILDPTRFISLQTYHDSRKRNVHLVQNIIVFLKNARCTDDNRIFRCGSVVRCLGYLFNGFPQALESGLQQ